MGTLRKNQRKLRKQQNLGRFFSFKRTDWKALENIVEPYSLSF